MFKNRFYNENYLFLKYPLFQFFKEYKLFNNEQLIDYVSLDQIGNEKLSFQIIFISNSQLMRVFPKY